jgi:PEP-CTERM motif
MKKLFKASLFALSIAIAGEASAAVIDFDTLGDGVEVNNQYSGVVFSSVSGSRILTTSLGAFLGSSPPNIICSGTASINCGDDVYVDFLSGISGLSFLAVGDNDSGIIGTVSAFAGMSLLGTVNIVGDGNFTTAQLVDISGFSGITRIEITHVTDLAGLGFDDFKFSSGGVPEPASWALMLAGFGLVGAAMRRRTNIALAFA